jgi:hypothetical protein
VTRRDTVGVGAVLVLVLGLGWLLWPSAGGGDVRMARATVVRAVHCGSSDAQDWLRVELLDGRAVPARLDGCGHRPGEVLTVEVSDPLPVGDVVARLPGTGVPAATADAQRIGAVGVAVAGIAGALLAWRLRRDRS